MPISADLLDRRATEFLLWIPRQQSRAPTLVIGELAPGNPPSMKDVRRLELAPVSGAGGLWARAASASSLRDGTAYHYWFEVDDSRSQDVPPARVCVTDPFACSVDWRVFPPDDPANTQPAAVVGFRAGKLLESDPGLEVAEHGAAVPVAELPPNARLVIYELPTSWALSRALHEPERAVATFLDVAALVDEQLVGANFAGLQLLAKGQSYLADLGVNCLELLPAADSFFKREWGYGTSHYLAPDYELGYPEGNLSPTANRDLAKLVASCHRKRIRFFIDVVMAFAHEEPYDRIDAASFHIDDPGRAQGDPDAWTSFRGDGTRSLRDGFGSTLWRYASRATTYDPIAGTTGSISPAAQLMLTSLTRWMRDFEVDGIRIDSVENIANWDFLEAFRDRARDLWRDRLNAAQLGSGADDRFLIVGEELSLPMPLLTNGVIDALWNEDFQTRVRAAISGESACGDDFEWTVKKALDCRLRGFATGAQAINYVTKHDVEGFRHERLFTMLRQLPDEQIEKRIKLAFACLLTANGIPMILAGEEFADKHDLFDEDGHVTQGGGKQVDPVNFGRLEARANPDQKTRSEDEDGWFGDLRRRVHAYVRRLIRFRTSTPALWIDDTEFFWSDFGEGKRVVCWRRGRAVDVPVVVVANFSDFGSAPGTGYVIPTWPRDVPHGKAWVEITQPVAQAGGGEKPRLVELPGREAIYPWEAKVYTLRDI